MRTPAKSPADPACGAISSPQQLSWGPAIAQTHSMKRHFPGFVVALLCAAGSNDIHARSWNELAGALAGQLARTAPSADPGVIGLGTHALACAKSIGAG